MPEGGDESGEFFDIAGVIASEELYLLSKFVSNVREG